MASSLSSRLTAQPPSVCLSVISACLSVSQSACLPACLSTDLLGVRVSGVEGRGDRNKGGVRLY